METAAHLELVAMRLRVEATRLDGVIVRYVEPAMRLLPEVWVGPAADHLERELLGHRRLLQAVVSRLWARAGSLEWQAAELRAAEAAGALGGVSGAL